MSPTYLLFYCVRINILQIGGMLKLTYDQYLYFVKNNSFETPLIIYEHLNIVQFTYKG